MTKSAKKHNIVANDDTIDLSLSNLTEVPVKEIAQFKRVTILDLSNNKITSLGANFGILTQLVHLDLSKNQISALPESFGKLVNLRHLDLYNNRLDSLPLEIGSLKSLRYLDLKGNPLKPKFGEIVGPCLTIQECQNAAKRVVPFYATLQVQVREDLERLLKEKHLHEAEQERLKREQQEQSERELMHEDGNNGVLHVAPASKPKPKRDRRRRDAPKQEESSNGNVSDDSKTAIAPQSLVQNIINGVKCVLSVIMRLLVIFAQALFVAIAGYYLVHKLTVHRSFLYTEIALPIAERAVSILNIIVPYAESFFQSYVDPIFNRFGEWLDGH